MHSCVVHLCQKKIMTEFLKIFLPAYFVVYFAIAFVIKSVVVAKRIGKSPLVLPKDDSAYGLIGVYFKLTLVALFGYVLLYAFAPEWHNHFLPIEVLAHAAVRYSGLGLLAISLIWTVAAQGHMKDSWRIGIDTESETELITTGLFRYSRNPIFLGMIGSLTGLFFTTPNALTALFLVLGYVLIQVQVRLEEEFLQKQHGEVFLAYKKSVRRWL